MGRKMERKMKEIRKIAKSDRDELNVHSSSDSDSSSRSGGSASEEGKKSQQTQRRKKGESEDIEREESAEVSGRNATQEAVDRRQLHLESKTDAALPQSRIQSMSRSAVPPYITAPNTIQNQRQPLRLWRPSASS